MRKEKITTILNELKEICNEKNLKIEDKDLMDFSVRVYLSEFIKASKSDEATEPQKKLLKELGIAWTPGLTKQEASNVIDGILNKRK